MRHHRPGPAAFGGGHGKRSFQGAMSPPTCNGYPSIGNVHKGSTGRSYQVSAYGSLGDADAANQTAMTTPDGRPLGAALAVSGASLALSLVLTGFTAYGIYKFATRK